MALLGCESKKKIQRIKIEENEYIHQKSLVASTLTKRGT